jgi:pyruvate dehydrogenase E1 component
MVRHLSDDQLKHLRVGGHDPVKVYNAYRAATPTKACRPSSCAHDQGYGMGEGGRRARTSPTSRRDDESDLRTFRDRFNVPIPDDRIADAPFYRPDEQSAEIAYMKERRASLGGFVPRRVVQAPVIRPKMTDVYDEFYKGTEGRKASTTMVFVKMLAKLLRDKEIGDLVVPIVPDEARTFGMESLFRAVGIYSSIGQVYEPVDMDTLLYYKEAKDGQILEEGITEAGSISSFIAAGTAYANQGVNTIRFLSSIRCSASSASATLSGRPRMRGAADSCSAARRAARRSPVKGCSIRMATATRWRCPCRRAGPMTRRTRTSSRRSFRTASRGCTARPSSASTTSP